MTFARAWMLALAWLPLAWAAWEWRHSARRKALALKSLSLLCVLLALAEPGVTIFESRTAVAILVDTSASLSQDDLTRASDIASRIEAARGRNWARVIPFAKATRSAGPSERPRSWKLAYTRGEAGRGTDFETAIREGEAALPAGLVPRLALISDGRENLGSAARAAWQARQLGIRVDTFSLAGRPKPGLLLDSVSLPANAFTGERFPVDLTLQAPRKTPAKVEVAAEGKTLGASEVVLEQGPNQVRVHASLSAEGAFDLSGSIQAPGLGEARFAQAISLKRPRLLYVSQDPPGTAENLLKILESAQFDVVASTGALPERLDGFQIVVLNNWDLEGIPPARKADLEVFVQRGGGLLVIGGERNIYVEDKPPEDPLERALPAKLAPPRTPEGAAVVLIVDKSSSMEGRKIELARLAAIGVIENLRPIDSLGVLIFDNTFQWAVPIRKAEDRSLLKRLVSGIVADGGTQIAPALAEAYRRILPVNAAYRHIVLLTDGISEEGDSLNVARQALLNRVTISTVGLGQDVNRAYLEKVAMSSGGKPYFLTEPSGLAQLLLRDVKEHTGSTAVEKEIRPIVLKQAGILEGVGMESAPPLAGYVRFISKPTADTILSVDRKDPLLARWQYGLGRAAVFASDAKSRWAAAWIGWSGYDRFWANLFRDLLPHAQAGEATVSFDRASGDLVVEYRLARGVDDPAVVPDIFAVGPQGFQSPVTVAKVSGGFYRGHVRIGDRRGLFRLRPLVDSRLFPEVGFYRQEEELLEYGSDEPLLRRIAEFTGGRFNPQPGQVFDAAGRTIASTMNLWPGLLALAVLLTLAELIHRKWQGILQFFRRQ